MASARRTAAQGDRKCSLQIKQAAAAGYLHYVYTLSDHDGVFYVGKGSGNRLFAHGRYPGRDSNWRKLQRIANGDVTRTVVAFFLDAADALALESELIHAGADTLTNIARVRVVTPRQAVIDRAQAFLARARPASEWQMPSWLKFPFAGYQTPAELAHAIIDSAIKDADSPPPRVICGDHQGRITGFQWSLAA